MGKKDGRVCPSRQELHTHLLSLPWNMLQRGGAFVWDTLTLPPHVRATEPWPCPQGAHPPADHMHLEWQRVPSHCLWGTEAQEGPASAQVPSVGRA